MIGKDVAASTSLNEASLFVAELGRLPKQTAKAMIPPAEAPREPFRKTYGMVQLRRDLQTMIARQHRDGRDSLLGKRYSKADGKL